jgi:hypothetical protein
MRVILQLGSKLAQEHPVEPPGCCQASAAVAVKVQTINGPMNPSGSFSWDEGLKSAKVNAYYSLPDLVA